MGSMLTVCDLTIVRSLEHEHRMCPDCDVCVFCTVPHFCCCGKCGPSCAHDHRPKLNKCFMMQELNHELDYSVQSNPTGQEYMFIDEAGDVLDRVWNSIDWKLVPSSVEELNGLSIERIKNRIIRSLLASEEMLKKKV